MVLLSRCFAILAFSFVILSNSLSWGANSKNDVKFEKAVIELAGKKIKVEIAQTMEQHERGLMFRKSLGPDEGMLFVFDYEQPLSFWMKNTLINLSIGYFDKVKRLVDIQEMKATSVMEQNPPSYPSKAPAMYALEMSQGWFSKNKIKLGSVLKLKSVRQ